MDGKYDGLSMPFRVFRVGEIWMGNDLGENGNPQEFHYKLITCYSSTLKDTFCPNLMMIALRNKDSWTKLRETGNPFIFGEPKNRKRNCTRFSRIFLNLVLYVVHDLIKFGFAIDLPFYLDLEHQQNGHLT